MSSGKSGQPGGTFTCASCGGVFPWNRSDAEIAAEAAELFPGMDVNDPAEAALVCDGCFGPIVARLRR